MQKAKAQEADADAQIAQKQVDLTKNKVSEDALKLQRSLRQLSAARDVAKLEWESIARQSGSGQGPGANRKRQYPGSAKCGIGYRRQSTQPTSMPNLS